MASETRGGTGRGSRPHAVGTTCRRRRFRAGPTPAGIWPGGTDTCRYKSMAVAGVEFPRWTMWLRYSGGFSAGALLREPGRLCPVARRARERSSTGGPARYRRRQGYHRCLSPFFALQQGRRGGTPRAGHADDPEGEASLPRRGVVNNTVRTGPALWGRVPKPNPEAEPRSRTSKPNPEAEPRSRTPEPHPGALRPSSPARPTCR